MQSLAVASMREIDKISRIFEGLANAEFKDINLSRSQYLYLIQIAENPGIISGRICDAVKADPSSASRALSSLEENGYIRKENRENNAKEKTLYLTKKGEKAYESIIKEERYNTSRAIADLDSDDLLSLYSCLLRLRRSIEPDWRLVKEGFKRPYEKMNSDQTPVSPADFDIKAYELERENKIMNNFKNINTNYAVIKAEMIDAKDSSTVVAYFANSEEAKSYCKSLNTLHHSLASSYYSTYYVLDLKTGNYA